MSVRSCASYLRISILLAAALLCGCGEAGAGNPNLPATFPALGPPVYEATAKFERSGNFNPNVISPLTDDETKRIRTAMKHDFKGRPAVEKLIEDLELARGPRFPRNDDGELLPKGKESYEELVAKLQDAIIVTQTLDKSNIELVAVTVRHTDRELVAKAANKLVENYLRQIRVAMDNSLLEKKKFLDSEATRYGREVQELEQQKLRFEFSAGRNESNDPDFQKLTRDLEASRALYEQSIADLRSTQLALTMAVSEHGMRLSVVQPAIKPFKPVEQQ